MRTLHLLRGREKELSFILSGPGRGRSKGVIAVFNIELIRNITFSSNPDTFDYFLSTGKQPVEY